MTLTKDEEAMIHAMRTAKVRLRILADIRMLPKPDAVLLLVEAMADSAPELLDFLKRMPAELTGTAPEKPAVQP